MEQTSTDLNQTTLASATPAGPVAPWSGRFVDTVEAALDAKGRLTLPASHRPAFGAGGVATLWAGPSVVLFTPDGFGDWLAHLGRRLRTSGYADIGAHFDFAHADASEFRPDVQGRFVVPDRLRVAAGIDRLVTVVGAGNRVHLWDPATYGRDLAELRADNEFFMHDYGVPGEG